MEAGKSEVQGHRQLQTQFEVRLSYRIPASKQTEETHKQTKGRRADDGLSGSHSIRSFLVCFCKLDLLQKTTHKHNVEMEGPEPSPNGYSYKVLKAQGTLWERGL